MLTWQVRCEVQLGLNIPCHQIKGFEIEESHHHKFGANCSYLVNLSEVQLFHMYEYHMPPYLSRRPKFYSN